jgi:hypothetical protein
MNKREAIAKLKCHADAVKALGATSLYLFGSVARDEGKSRSVLIEWWFLHPELIHPDKAQRVPGLEGVPLVEIGRIACRIASAMILHDRPGETDKRETILANEPRDCRNGHMMLVGVEKEVAARARGEKIRMSGHGLQRRASSRVKIS